MDIALPKIASNEKVYRFVKNLNIGNISKISNYPGASRTVIGLVSIIFGFHLGLPRLSKQLMLV